MMRTPPHFFKFPIFLLLALVSFFLSGCGKEKVTEKYPNGKSKVVRNYGWIGGESKENLKRERVYYFNGNLESDTRFKSGQRHGDYHDFWHNGQKKSDGQFVKGKKEGTWLFFFNQFTPSAKGVFKADLKEGTWRQFWETGASRAEGDFHQGKEIGLQKEWDVKGDILIENSCFESNPSGLYHSYYPSKTPKEEYGCTKGLPDGLYTRKDMDGMIVEKGHFDSAGRKDSVWETFHPDGKRASLKHLRQGFEFDSSFVWDLAGRLRERAYFDSGTGEHLRYDSLGHLVERQHFFKSHPEGESWTYYTNGNKHALVLYKEGLPTELHKWYANGKLRTEGQFTQGKYSGEWKEYGENGTLLQSSQYQDGTLHGLQLFYDTNGKLTRTLRYEHGYPAEGKIPAALAAGIEKQLTPKNAQDPFPSTQK